MTNYDGDRRVITEPGSNDRQQSLQGRDSEGSVAEGRGETGRRSRRGGNCRRPLRKVGWECGGRSQLVAGEEMSVWSRGFKKNDPYNVT